MPTVAKGSVLLTPKFDNLTSSISRQLDSAFAGSSGIGSKAGAKTGAAFSSGVGAKVGAVAGIVSAVTGKAFTAISRSLDSAISRVDTMNNFPKVMAGLGYGADAATSSIDKMSDHLTGLPTRLDAMTSSVQKIVPTVKDVGKATDIMLAFNDALLAGGASTQVQEAALEQFCQVLAKGKPEMEDWRSIVTAMPGQMDQVAKSMLGPTASTNDLYNALKTGKVSVEDLEDAFISLDKNGYAGFDSFAQQAKTGTAGIATSMANLQNSVTKAVAACIDAIGVENITAPIQGATTLIKNFGNAIAGSIADIRGTLSEFSGDMSSVAAPIVAQVISFVAQCVAVVMPAIQSVLTCIQTAMPLIQAWINAALSVIQAIWNAVWPAMSTVTTSVLSVVSAMVQGTMAVIQAIIQTVMAVIDGDWSGAWTGIQSVASAIWGAIESVISAYISAVSAVISSVLSSISGVWSSTWGAIKGAFSSIWEGIKSAAQSGVNSVYTTVTGIKDKITGFFAGAGSWLVESGKAILNGLKSGIESAVGAVTSSVSGAVERIRGLFPFSPAKWGPFSGHGYTTYSGRALMGDFGESIVAASAGTAAMASKALARVEDVFSVPTVSFASADAAGARSVAIGSAAPAGLGVVERGDTYYINIDGSLLEVDERIARALKELIAEVKRSSRSRRG